VKRAAAILLGLVAVWPSSEAHAIDKEQCAAAAEQAQSFRGARRLRDARASLLQCAQNACPQVVRSDCVTWLAEISVLLPSLVFEAKDESGADLTDVRVSVGDRVLATRLDGVAVDVDPGELTLRFEAPGRVPVEQKVVVAEGQKARGIRVELRSVGPAGPDASAGPAATASGSPVPWAFLGVGVAGVAAFGILQGVAQSNYADLEDGCGVTRTCTEDELAPVRGQFVGSAIALGIGGAALITAAVLFVVDAADPAPPSTAGKAQAHARGFVLRF
jgi:hypothetical protein